METVCVDLGIEIYLKDVNKKRKRMVVGTEGMMENIEFSFKFMIWKCKIP